MFVKGKSGNPAGKPKGVIDYVQKLQYALKNFETKNGKSFIEFAMERAEKEDAVLIAILKKILPDLSADTGMRDAIRTILIRPSQVIEVKQIEAQKVEPLSISSHELKVVNSQ